MKPGAVGRSAEEPMKKLLLRKQMTLLKIQKKRMKTNEIL